VYLRALDRRDVPELVAIHRAIVGPAMAWSAAVLEAQLWDPNHGHGRQVMVAVDEGTIAGVAGWVEVGREFFGSPVLARDDRATSLFVDELIARARTAGAARIRIGCADSEDYKRAVLVARGFSVQLHFVTLSCAAEPRDATPPAGLVRVPLATVAPEVLRDVHDASMLEIDNSGPMSLDDARHQQARAWPDGSGVWFDGDRPAGFMIVIRDCEPIDHAVIDQVGVAPSWRRRGIARALVDRAIDLAGRAGVPEVRALIASSNRASLALHVAAGLREISRREMLQLELI
jgi:ribosomal protein S18 acetylase RimI-like enzyme